jgi:carbonic anhydrase
VLVLGHENCGAIKAVIEGKTQVMPAISLIIGSAIKDAKTKDPKQLLKESIKENALHMRDLLLKSAVVGNLAKNKKIEVRAGYYHLETGEVELL